MDNNSDPANSGSYCAASASYIRGVGILYPDNWLVSPRVQLGGFITLMATGTSEDFAEKFSVAVCTDGTPDNPDNFQTMDNYGIIQYPWDYREYLWDLGDYSGQEGYVAIRHYDCSDQFHLDIDDITIYAEGNKWEKTIGHDGSYYEGPSVELTGLKENTEYIMQVEGVRIMGSWFDWSHWSPIYHFSTLGEGIENIQGSYGQNSNGQDMLRGQKLLRNGQFLIRRADKFYNILGTPLH